MSSFSLPLNRAPHGVFLAMIALALGGLFLGSGEFASMSLLPAMARSTGISIPAAGGYISAYALGVVIGAPLIAAFGASRSRKTLLLGLMGLFFVGYMSSALAWNHGSLLIARFISGLPHGAYYGVAALVAASLVPAHRQTQAIGYVMMGLAAANVIGVPVVTWIGQQTGWRTAFALIACGGILTAVLLWFCLPAMKPMTGLSVRTELSALNNRQVWLIFAVASIGFGGMFAVYSYITPTLTEITRLGLQDVPWALAAWGLGMLAGNLLGGWLADRALAPAIFGILIWNALVLSLFSWSASSVYGAVGTLFLLGNGFALVPALQSYLMQIAGQAQTLAAALNHSAFNLANALGASLGGLAIAHHFGWASTGWIGGLLSLSGLVLMGLEHFCFSHRVPRIQEGERPCNL